MKLFATSILTFALLGIVTTASTLDGEACTEGEKQCALNGHMVGQCVNGKWTIVNICKPGDICVENATALCASNPDRNVPFSAESDISAIEDLGNNGAEFPATEETLSPAHTKIIALPSSTCFAGRPATPKTSSTR